MEKTFDVDREIGERLALLRKKRGISQIELAKEIGVNKRTLCSYEKGLRRIPTALLPKVAATLKVSADEILGIANTALDGRSADARLMRRFQKISALPPEKRKTVVHVLDTLLADVGQ